MLMSGETRAVSEQHGSDPTVERFAAQLSALPTVAAIACRGLLTQARDELGKRFEAADPVEALVAAHAALIDHMLVALWREAGIDESTIALVAVGGYGRGELHPHSDIDIMLLLDDTSPPTDAASAFVTSLWDTGLEIGHSVRTVDQCQQEARADVSVATTLMESRLLCGPTELFQRMRDATDKHEIWNSAEFFNAKRDEQRARHRRYDDTGYNLEPNVKGSPGGLRDIQLVGWVAKRHFGAADFSDLVTHEFLTPGQHRRLVEGRHFLWTIRYGLHVLTGRREDRLLFDHQKSLALMLGYEDARFTLGVEQMMQRYYRTVMELSRLNEMLLQLFEESILLSADDAPRALSDSFEARNNYLQVVDDDVFARNPSALLELFLCMQRNSDLKGVSARTIGLLRRSRHLIDEQFRQHPRNHRLFLEIISAPHGVTRELRRMNRYGLLGRYIPAFGRIVGRMQYDLFHAYTVDEHTLFVVSNLRRFALERFDDEHPHCAWVMQQLDDQSLAILAGLFHDIAKGRGGDHSELGAIDALAFCREHGLPERDATLVAWLVRQHLALSMTAQKKDISDPQVIARFANVVGDQRHLDYLYVLTAADVRATNPKLWNSWKSKLFRDLYEATTEALSRGLENPLEKPALIDQSADAARQILNGVLAADDIDSVFSILPGEYFLRHDADEIAWHVTELHQNGLEQSLVAVKPNSEHSSVAIMLYTPHIQHTFAAATATLDQLGFSVLDARLEPLANPYSLDTYIVVEDGGGDVSDERVDDLRSRLAFIPAQPNTTPPKVSRMPARRQKMFDTDTRLRFRADETGGRTIMEVTCADHPGLLLTVGKALIQCNVYINAAKIVTIGERAEDVFYLTDAKEKPLTEAQCEQLRETLLGALESAHA